MAAAVMLSWEPKDYRDLVDAIEYATKKGRETFELRGEMFDVRYARYLAEHLRSEFAKRGVEV